MKTKNSGKHHVIFFIVLLQKPLLSSLEAFNFERGIRSNTLQSPINDKLVHSTEGKGEQQLFAKHTIDSVMKHQTDLQHGAALVNG